MEYHFDRELLGLIVEDVMPIAWYPGDPEPKLEDYDITVSIHDDLENSCGYHTKKLIPFPKLIDSDTEYAKGWNACIKWIKDKEYERKVKDGYFDGLNEEDDSKE